MSFKYLGRLAGKTSAFDALTLTSPASTRLPFVAPTPGTKLLPHGENVTAEAFNRALASLQDNIEHVAGILNSAASRSTVLEPYTAEDLPTGRYGFQALTGVVCGQEAIGLAEFHAPTVWMFHGVHKQSVAGLVRLVNSEMVEDSAVHGAVDVCAPVDIRETVAGDSIFPVFSPAGGSSINSPASAIVPIRRVVADNFPYSGGTASGAIATFDTDGVIVGAGGYSARVLRAQAGVFVELSGADEMPGVSDCDGLYRVELIADSASGEKLVLSSGGLTKIRVDDASTFSAGLLVRWAPYPDHAAVIENAENNSNLGYVVYKVGNDLYMASVGAIPDVRGYGSGFTEVLSSIDNFGSVGLVDHEDSSTANHVMPAGTVLWCAGGSAAVVSVRAASEPLSFPIGAADGVNFYVCTPLGYSLNPIVDFPAGLIHGGDYYMECRVLTTNTDKVLMNNTLATVAGDTDNRFTFSDYEVAGLKKYLRELRQGDSAHGAAVLPSLYTAPAATVLGSALWVLTVLNGTNPGDEAHYADQYLSPGDIIQFDSITAHGTDTSSKAVVISVSGNTVFLLGTTRAFWSTRRNLTLAPIVAGSTFTVSANAFTVDSIVASPAIVDSAGGSYYRGEGLQAAYDNDMSASAVSRGLGAGRTIEIRDGKPITLLTSATEGVIPYVHKVHSDALRQSLLSSWSRDEASPTKHVEFLLNRTEGAAELFSTSSELRFVTTAGVLRGRLRWTTVGLSFSDSNTTDYIRLSGAGEFGALPLLLEDDSVIGVLHALSTSHVGATEVASKHARTPLGTGVLYSPDEFNIGFADATLGGSELTVNIAGTILTMTIPGDVSGIAGGDVVALPYQDVTTGAVTVHYATISDVSGAAITIDPAYPEASAVIPKDTWYFGNLMSVQIQASDVLVVGRKFTVPKTVLADAAANYHGYITYDTVANSVQWSPTARGDTIGEVTIAVLAEITTGDLAVTSIRPASLQAMAALGTTELIVGHVLDNGNADGTYARNNTHFSSIAAAFQYITAQESMEVVPVARTWKIRVVSNVSETDSPLYGISLPLKVPADGIVIECGENAVVSWSRPTHLFDLNGKSGFTLRGGSYDYTGAASFASLYDYTGNGPRVSVVCTGAQASGVQQCYAFTLENVLVTDASALCSIYDTGSFGRVRVTNCRAVGVICGVYVRGADTDGQTTNVVVDGLYCSSDITRAGTPWDEDAPRYAVYVKGCGAGASISNIETTGFIGTVFSDVVSPLMINNVRTCTGAGCPAGIPLMSLTQSVAISYSVASLSCIALLADADSTDTCLYVNGYQTTTITGLTTNLGNYGLRIDTGADMVTLDGAEISGCITAGIYANGSNTKCSINAASVFDTPIPLKVSNRHATAAGSTFTVGTLQGTAELPASPAEFCAALISGNAEVMFTHCTLNAVITYLAADHGKALYVDNTPGSQAAVYATESSFTGGRSAVYSEDPVFFTDCSFGKTAAESGNNLLSVAGATSRFLRCTIGDSAVDYASGGLYITGASAVVDTCEFAGFTTNNKYSINLSADADWTKVTGNSFTNCRHPIFANGCDSVVLINNTVVGGCDTAAIRAASCNSLLVNGLICTDIGSGPGAGTYESGAILLDTCVNSLVSNVVVNGLDSDSTTAAIRLRSCENTRLTALTLLEVISGGTDIYDAGTAYTYGVVNLSDCTLCTVDGLDVRHAAGDTSDSVVFCGGSNNKLSGSLLVPRVRLISEDVALIEGCAVTATFETESAGSTVLSNCDLHAGTAAIGGGTVTFRGCALPDTTLTLGSASTAYVDSCRTLSTASLRCTAVTLLDIKSSELGDIGVVGGNPLAATTDRVGILKIRNSGVTNLKLERGTSISVLNSRVGRLNIIEETVGGAVTTEGHISNCKINEFVVTLALAYNTAPLQPAPDSTMTTRIKAINCDFTGEWIGYDDPDCLTGYSGVINCTSGVTIYNSVVVSLAESQVAELEDPGFPGIPIYFRLDNFPQWGNIELDDTYTP